MKGKSYIFNSNIPHLPLMKSYPNLWSFFQGWPLPDGSLEQGFLSL